MERTNRPRRYTGLGWLTTGSACYQSTQLVSAAFGRWKEDVRIESLGPDRDTVVYDPGHRCDHCHGDAAKHVVYLRHETDDFVRLCSVCRDKAPVCRRCNGAGQYVRVCYTYMAGSPGHGGHDVPCGQEFVDCKDCLGTGRLDIQKEKSAREERAAQQAARRSNIIVGSVLSTVGAVLLLTRLATGRMTDIWGVLGMGLLLYGCNLLWYWIRVPRQ